MWEDRNQDKQVRILVKHSPEFPSSVYYRQEDNSQLIKEPPIDLLGKLLIWLSNDNDLYSIKEEL